MVCPVTPDDDFNAGFVALIIIFGLLGFAGAFADSKKNKAAEKPAMAERAP